MIIPSVTLNKDMGTVTIDRLFVLVIPNTADNVDSFMEWFQNQPEVTPHHNALMLETLQKTIVSDDFWQTVVNPTPDIHPILSDTPDGDRVDSKFCIRSIKAFAADGNIEQVTAWGLFTAKMLMDSEIDIAWRLTHDTLEAA